jgi:hypothetical protein
MLGLSRDLVEHALPVKQGFQPYKQPLRNYNTDLLGRIKEEVEPLLKAGFIRTHCYAEWISNIDPVEKKNTGKSRVCVDFRNLNRAAPKDKYPMPDEYPMPVADNLINKVSSHKIISFLDGNAGYNQTFMAEQDVPKMAFQCPDFVGLFEWEVMTFGLKNAGATYQRAMNLIFHDPHGALLEVYIHDSLQENRKFSSAFLNSSVPKNKAHISSSVPKPMKLFDTDEYRQVCSLVN